MDATQLLLSRLPSFRKVGENRFVARCPSHDDRSPSLSISRGDKGALCHCFAGCSVPDILEALDLNVEDLFDAPLVKSARSNNPESPATNRWNVTQVLSGIRDELTLSSLLLRKFLAEGTVTNGDMQTLIGCQYQIDEAIRLLK